MASFEKAIPLLLKWEGGYVNHPNDKGGETKYGITKKRYPCLDIANLTIDTAKSIYKDDFWKPNKIAYIDSQDTANQFFDMVVNHNPKDAVKMVQRALNDLGIKTVVDGIIGANTLSNINKANQESLNKAIAKRRVAFYKMLIDRDSSQKVFEKGWLARANFYAPAGSNFPILPIVGILTAYILYSSMRKS